MALFPDSRLQDCIIEYEKRGTRMDYDKKLMTIDEFCEYVGIGKTKARVLFGQGLTTDAKDWVRDGKVLISSTLQNMNLSGETESWGILFTLDEKPEYIPYVEKIVALHGESFVVIIGMIMWECWTGSRC